MFFCSFYKLCSHLKKKKIKKNNLAFQRYQSLNVPASRNERRIALMVLRIGLNKIQETFLYHRGENKPHSLSSDSIDSLKVTIM